MPRALLDRLYEVDGLEPGAIGCVAHEYAIPGTKYARRQGVRGFDKRKTRWDSPEASRSHESYGGADVAARVAWELQAEYWHQEPKVYSAIDRYHYEGYVRYCT